MSRSMSEGAGSQAWAAHPPSNQVQVDVTPCTCHLCPDKCQLCKSLVKLLCHHYVVSYLVLLWLYPHVLPRDQCSLSSLAYYKNEQLTSSLQHQEH